MNINFGLFPEIEPIITPNGKKRYLKGSEKKQAQTSRALEKIKEWINVL